MLKSISIKNIVLIDDLTVEFGNGLCILTGETGSGKSILLGALGLAIGDRFNSRLLRDGEKQGFVNACFDIKENTSVINLLSDYGIECDDTLILRRVIAIDGKSKAFINDIPVSQNLLQIIGHQLVEIHGQHDQSNLLNQSFHREILDDYGGLRNQVVLVKKLFDEMESIRNRYLNIVKEKEKLKKDKEYLQNTIDELTNLNYQSGEEEELSNVRISLINRDKIREVLSAVMSTLDGGQNSVTKLMAVAQNYLSKNISLGENLLGNKNNAFDSIITSLDKSLLEFNEAIGDIESIIQNLDEDNGDLNEVEERLFYIKDLCRKYHTTAEELNNVLASSTEKLKNLEGQEIECNELETSLTLAEKKYNEAVLILRSQRKQTGEILANNLLEELEPLKMNNVRFMVSMEEVPASCNGIDSVKFMVATNVGSKFDELSKIASGGELSRFMLALKVVLLKVRSVPTLIFDEIDSGVSGYVANAIGERLKKLGKILQVFVVTHLPQVASKGDFHLKVEKQTDNINTITIVKKLNSKERIKEIARMISGNVISEEAIKNAERLLTSS